MATVNDLIDRQCAELAAVWCDYLEQHARRVYGLVIGTGPSKAKLARKIREGKLSDGFTVRDVYRHEWSGLTDPDTTEAACDALVKDKWLRVVKAPPTTTGGPATVRHLINPKIAELKL